MLGKLADCEFSVLPARKTVVFAGDDEILSADFMAAKLIWM